MKVELSDTELADVAAFWSRYLSAGGDEERPPLFMYEALNDKKFRDAFLFWAAGATFPEADELNRIGVKFAGSQEVFDLLGPTPDNPEVLYEGLKKAIDGMNNNGVEPDDTDAGTVLVLAWSIWQYLLGQPKKALVNLNYLAQANFKYAEIKALEGGEFEVIHGDPLKAFSMAGLHLMMLEQQDPEKALAMAMDMFSVKEGSPTHLYVKQQRELHQGLARLTSALQEKEQVNESK